LFEFGFEVSTKAVGPGVETRFVPQAAPRIYARLVAALARLDTPGKPIAETHRDLGLLADHLRIPRPSYEQARVTVHALRAARKDPVVGKILVDIAFRVRPPEALVETLSGTRTT
jgi:hypothetical protein